MKKRLLLFILISICVVGCGKKDPVEESVNNYILNSKKAAFIDTAVAFSDKIMMEVNKAVNYKFYDTNTLYMIPVGHNKEYSCVTIESGGQSLFSDKWNYIYVGVTFNGKGYNYYFIGEDKANYGLDFIEKMTLLNSNISIIYNKSKEKESGYDILKKEYNNSSKTNVYDEQSNEYKKLSKILKTNDGNTYNKIVLISVKECQYKESFKGM